MQAPAAAHQVDNELLDYVNRLERNPYGWRAAHLHLSQLRPHHRRDYQLRIAASEFDGLLRRFKSELFQLSNGDVVFLWEGASAQDVDRVVLRLRYLFSDDPLVMADEDERAGEAEGEAEEWHGGELRAQPRFCTWFDLEHDYDGFRYRIEDLVGALGQQPVEAGPAGRGRPLEPEALTRLEGELAQADLGGFIRRQPVCVMLPQSPPQPVFREVHVALGDLAKHLAPGVDLTANTWLFQHLAETLDEKLLDGLAEAEETAETEPISVNLRLATLLSPAFLKFDDRFRRHNRYQVIVELQLIDIYAELGAYLFIREFMRDRGYRICIDGLHFLHLPLVNRKRLGADLIKLVWSPDVVDEVQDARHEQLEAAIRQAGVERVVLCRCDSADAISWGRSLGIKMFQGHYIDSRLRAARPPAVAAARQAMRGGKDDKAAS